MNSIVLKKGRRPTSVPLARIRQAVITAYKNDIASGVEYNPSISSITITKRAVPKKSYSKKTNSRKVAK